MLSLLQWRLTCRGDLATSRLRVLNPPSHFLVGAGHECRCNGVTGIVLGFYSCYYAIVGEEGKEWKKENRKRGEGETIVCVATIETDGKEKQDLTHRSEGKQCSLFFVCTKKNASEDEDQVNMTCLLYMDLLKGGSTLTLTLAFLSSSYTCWPTAYIEWNTMIWAMLLA